MGLQQAIELGHRLVVLGALSADAAGRPGAGGIDRVAVGATTSPIHRGPVSIVRNTTDDSYISMIGIISMVPSIIVRCGQVLDVRWMPLMLLPCST